MPLLRDCVSKVFRAVRPPRSSIRLLVRTLFLSCFLTYLLPDLSVYSFRHRPVPFPGRRS